MLLRAFLAKDVQLLPHRAIPSHSSDSLDQDGALHVPINPLPPKFPFFELLGPAIFGETVPLRPTLVDVSFLPFSDFYVPVCGSPAVAPAWLGYEFSVELGGLLTRADSSSFREIQVGVWKLESQVDVWSAAWVRGSEWRLVLIRTELWTPFENDCYSSQSIVSDCRQRS